MLVNQDIRPLLSVIVITCNYVYVCITKYNFLSMYDVSIFSEFAKRWDQKKKIKYEGTQTQRDKHGMYLFISEY